MKCKNKSTCKRIRNCTSEIQALCKSFEEEKTVVAVTKEELAARKLAEVIHDTTCTFNHVDACDWGYSSWDNLATQSEFSARNCFLKTAKKMLKIANLETAIAIVKCLK